MRTFEPALPSYAGKAIVDVSAFERIRPVGNPILIAQYGSAGVERPN